MKIAEFGALQMARTDLQHFGKSKISSVQNSGEMPVINSIKGVSKDSELYSLGGVKEASSRSFQSYLMEALNSVNGSQLEVNAVQEKLITNPDDVDIHDVTIAMSKARMSLNLAQNVIDRITTSWNEITTTR